ncbi:glycosyltransferase family 2 protein [Alteribacter natronophilus]|uniref:glycosyltransferase family 2 protein n=1 Tax=Alteribacter natronophilus TaxID=2583810 RepID=UPI00110DC46B|nr:glycosyltransferase family 2 protein [Alteribacter natronophilus]TMW72349.1 glycosyltransferase family 2 protein [Alteribacter natronophilus]
MLKKLIKKTIATAERTVYRAVPPKQRDYLKNRLTDKQKQVIKKLFFSGKWQRREINAAKHRMNNLGFTEAGLEELKSLTSADDPYLSRLAKWELVQWYGNQYSQEEAAESLKIISELEEEEHDPVRKRQLGIMKAECLDLLGQIDEAKAVIERDLKEEVHPDLLLAGANLESSEKERLSWINRMYRELDLQPLRLSDDAEKPPYDRIGNRDSGPGEIERGEAEKVSVIMPVYNAEDVLHTSLCSILNQTWTNIELFVVDDCSSDETLSVARQFAEQDSRVNVIQADRNGGAYKARNLALSRVTGDFVTVHDADDWSHPQKFEKQVQHLIKHENVMGNTSQQARATNDLKFYRRGKPGIYIFSNMSSFMFRRKEVTEALGYWDTVRFAADSEFIRRIKKVFGERSVVEVPTGPLSFQRQTETSLTGNSAFGYHGFKMGARREYEEAHDFHHNKAGSSLYYSFPQHERPFAVPEPMWPEKEDKTDGYRMFDVVYAADFRKPEEQAERYVSEIRQLSSSGLKVGLVQLFTYDLDPGKVVSSEIRELLNRNEAYMVVYGESVTCRHLVIRDSEVLDVWQKYVPSIRSEEMTVVVEAEPEKASLQKRCEHADLYFGEKGTWMAGDDASLSPEDLPEGTDVSRDKWKVEALNVHEQG